MPRQAKRASMEFEKCEYRVDMRQLATDCISLFFFNKKWFCGGPIPQAELLSDSNIKTVMRTRFDKRWEVFVHGTCLPLIPDADSHELRVRRLIRLLEDMGSVWIPGCFRSGMVLLYFKICWGVKIPPPPLL
jgi:hypothetical protein